MGDVFNDGSRFSSTAFMINNLHIGYLGGSDIVTRFHHPPEGNLVPDGGTGTAVPCCDAVFQYALNGAAIKLHKNLI